jgi:Sigma-70 region 2
MPQVHDVSELVLPSQSAGLLRDLLDLTARRDRVAFAALYECLAPPVHQVAVRLLPDGPHARAVVQATFLEVWHLAGLASDYRDVWAWVTVITERRTAERVCIIAGGYATYTYHDLQTAHDLGCLLAADG